MSQKGRYKKTKEKKFLFLLISEVKGKRKKNQMIKQKRL